MFDRVMNRAGLAATALAITAWLATGADAAGVGGIERLDPRLDALIPPGAVLQRIVDGQEWTEGPLWDSSGGALLFSDVPRNRVYRWSGSAGVTSFLERSGYGGVAPFDGREPGSNGLAFDREGRLVLCQHGDRRVVRLETDGRFTVLADRFEVGG
jgi:gluconolactonase